MRRNPVQLLLLPFLRLAGAVRHLPNFLRLYWRLFCDPRVSMVPKALLVGAVVYLISPYDILPDIVPLAGYLDDGVILFFAIRAFIRLCPADVVREHVARIDRGE